MVGCLTSEIRMRSEHTLGTLPFLLYFWFVITDKLHINHYEIYSATRNIIVHTYFDQIELNVYLMSFSPKEIPFLKKTF